MHDDIPLTVGRATRVLAERILPAVHPETVPLEVSVCALPGEPIPPAEGLALAYEPYTVGTPWGPAWSTTWFRVRAAVPPEWAGRRVEALIDLGFDVNMPGFQCEALVYRPDGTPVKSVNPRNQWVPVAGDTVDLFLEAAANPVLLDYHPFLPTQEGDIRTSSARPLYTTRRLDLAVLDEQAYELALDIDVLLDLQAQLPESGPRRMRILQALDNALDVLDLQDIAGTAEQSRACLREVLESPAEASAHRIAAIGHAHIDSAWLWPLRETIRKVARTASSMTELIDNDPGFLYGMSSAQQYAWLKEHRPEVFQRVAKAVQEGRFVPLGGMWVESDTVMPTGEALVRQFSYGQRFFREEFGVECQGVWLPDSFGYSPALPQLIRRAGFQWFFTQKISWNQVNKFPHHTFLWEGIDGSRVFTHFPPMDTYNSQLSGAELARAGKQFRENRLATSSLAPVGWGDGGGGTTREMAGRARRTADLEGSARVEWKHPDDFFAEAMAELPHPPVWVGELYLELHRATLTSQHQTKQGNRRSEHLLIEAELWAATAAVRAGVPYPYEEIDALWRDVLLHQFHDILPGTSIAWVHREAVAAYARIQAAASAIIESSVRALAGEGSVPLTFNPAPFARNGVPALGAAVAEPREAPVAADGLVLDNGVVRVTLSPEGLITSAVDLATGRDAIAPGQAGNLLQLHQDFPNMWDAWDVDRFYRNRVTDIRAVTSLTVEPGRVIVEREFSKSRIRQTLSLAPGSRTLLIGNEIDWHETEKFLKVAFPFDIRAEHVAAETQFGYQKRVTHTNTSWEAAKFETSMHRFVQVEDSGFGAALITDATYGYDLTRDSAPDAGITTTVRLSLLRAPRFPDPATDQGPQTCTFGLVIGADTGLATTEGIALNLPERAITGGHGVDPLISVEGEGILVSSVKLADDRSGDLVVRVYEAQGRRATGTLTLHSPITSATTATLLERPLTGTTATDGRIPLALTPFEVRTLRFGLR
ncbi:glycoside hydrolase family 38 C-terminal domain-containing protein [Actinoplanes sp. N902-109]|uniref:alpha-mannosidase n=1 Tax=Actinoplanes sp. (strain N902-109) TaxID=649831 RepID=UPI000329525F|nr:glycoside hydrolase family 38 C-terminal domain-containing protein [Actinoplanes sp. N902-109]AGL14317.1 alpha-mannosidase [Actinoplanes sp. N902-109]